MAQLEETKRRTKECANLASGEGPISRMENEAD